jgi:hypothetical protein
MGQSWPVIRGPLICIVFQGKHNGTANQLFIIEEGGFYIKPPNYLTGELAYLVRLKDRGLVVDRDNRSSANNNLYGHVDLGGRNQRFFFDPISSIPNSGRLRVYQRHTDQIDFPPQPMSLNDPGPGSFVPINYTLISETIIPFAYVYDNNLSYQWQAANSPYYRLERYRYYKFVRSYPIPYGVQYSIEGTNMTGMTESHKQSFKKTFGVEMSISGQVVIKASEALGVTLGANLKHNLGVESVTESSTVITNQKIETTRFSKVILDAQLFYLYSTVDAYKLYRMNDIQPIDEWEVPLYEEGKWTSYPPSAINKESGLKSTSDITKFVQRPLKDLVPRMYSNTTPIGQASASSVYSTTYLPWKAFDGDDEDAPWSRWISASTSPYTTQWLAYEFPEPVTIMAYTILPETGSTTINRTPKSWRLQAWTGSSWITLDTRTGYTITDWQAENSRTFSVQYPKKYKKFRLWVTEVNGSTVVSIRMFKLLGSESETLSLKSTTKSMALVEPEYIETQFDEAPGFNLEIFPNPNRGRFTIRLNGIDNINNQSLSDSLFLFNELSPTVGGKNDIPEGSFLVEVLDLAGQTIHSEFTNENTLDINLNVKGIFIVKITINNKIISRRVIIN